MYRHVYNTVAKFVALCLIAFLYTGCTKNPLIGKWESEDSFVDYDGQDMKVVETLEFFEKDIFTLTGRMFDTEDDIYAEYTVNGTYKVEDDQIKYTVKDDDVEFVIGEEYRDFSPIDDEVENEYRKHLVEMYKKPDIIVSESIGDELVLRCDGEVSRYNRTK